MRISKLTRYFFSPETRLAVSIGGVFAIWYFFPIESVADKTAIYLIAIISNILVWFLHYRIEIDSDNNTFRTPLCLFNLCFGKKKRYQGIEKIFLNQVTISQGYTSQRSFVRATTSKKIYQAFLKFDSGEKIFIDSDTVHDKLLDRANEFAKSIGTIVQPYQ